MKDNNITLTKTEMNDLNAFFEFQLDEEANYLAAFTSKNPNDKTAYIEKYVKFTYWIDRKFWKQGIASTALKEFLQIELTRPIFGRVAFDNFGSQKVLEKCGFVKIGLDKGFANARQTEIEEFIYKLSD